jgi:hypothetical protein
VVVPGEGGDGRRDVVLTAEVEGDQAKPRGPAFRAVDQPLEPCGVHCDHELREQRRRLVVPEGEIRRTHVAHQARQAEAMQRPRRISTRRDQQRKPRRRPFDEP